MDINKYEINIYEQIAKNIKKYRKAAGMTQAVLAEKVGVSHEFIRRNESAKGKKSFSVDTVWKIAVVLNIDPGKLFEIDMDELNKELEKVKTGTKEEKIDFIEKNYEYYSIAPEFIEDSYSYKIDPDFWITEFQKPLTDRLNYRKLEEQMIKRVVEVNGNSSSRWFGISYIRVQNIFNIERDFILQYYTIGIIGLVLFIFIPFIASIIMCGCVILKKSKDLLNIENMLLIASVILILGIAYFSGNIIDSLIITIYMSFIIGILFNNIFKEKSESKDIEE